MARELAHEFEKTVVERDRANQRPFIELKKLRESGLFNLLIPKAYGGEGGSIRDAAHVILELSKGDGSLAGILAFHYYNSQMARYLDPKGDGEKVQRRSAKNRWLWGNATQYVNKNFIAEEHPEGGYVVSGTKLWNTGAPVADVTTVLAIHPNKKQYLYFYIPTDREGPEVPSTIGINSACAWPIRERSRSTRSAFIPMSFSIGPTTACRPARLRSGPPSAPSSTRPSTSVRRWPYWSTRKIIRARNAGRVCSRPVSIRPRMIRSSRRNTAIYLIKVQAAEAFFEVVIAEAQAVWDARKTVTDIERGALALRTLALRAFTANVALEVTPKIYDFAGGRATGSAYGFDRFWRNVRQLSVHDPQIYSLRNLGDHTLNDKPFKFPNVFESKAHAAPIPEGKPKHDPTLPLNSLPYLETINGDNK